MPENCEWGCYITGVARIAQEPRSLDMMILHDIFIDMAANTSTLTERGQVSMPASIRKQMRLRAGQRLRWERISDRECRILVEPGVAAGPIAVLGYGPKFRGDHGRRTNDWMGELRAGEGS
jgi:AbrB family looped-hinge helix DNA binding protein